MKSFRDRPEYQEWKRQVKEKYDNTCQLCGHKGNIHAHHIKPVSVHPELAFDVDNGVALCGHCHAEYKNREDELEKVLLEAKELSDSGEYHYIKAVRLYRDGDYPSSLSVVNQGLELLNNNCISRPNLLALKTLIMFDISGRAVSNDEECIKALEELRDFIERDPLCELRITNWEKHLFSGFAEFEM